MASKLRKHSKFLSYVLRHKPESIGIGLDNNGWVVISILLAASRSAGQDISEDLLTEIVDTVDYRTSLVLATLRAWWCFDIYDGGTVTVV